MLDLSGFERLVRQAHNYSQASETSADGHPFVARNIHADFPPDVRKLFDNGHYAQATFEALKYLDEEVQRISSLTEIGRKLMMAAFNENNPKLALNTLATANELNEQEGFKYLFAGTQVGIRNPRGHKSGVVDDPETCLDHLSLASMLLRRLDTAGLR